MAEEEDLFGAFGDDSDSDGAPDESDGTKKAQALIQSANAAAGSKARESQNEALVRTTPTTEVENTVAETVDLTNLETCKLESCEDPLYLSPDVKLVSALPFGGGRGYIATKDLKPGTLVMVEKSIMTWPDEQLGTSLTLSSVHRLLHHPDGAKVVHCLEDFHPTKEVVDSTEESESPDQIEIMLESLRQKHKDDKQLNQLVEDAQKLEITNRNGSALNATDILRIFLALQYNGLESGLYCHVAMINHQCQPNCVKFLPNGRESDLPKNCSEVRTTRSVKAGECVTISYMPKMVSHASRRRHLWDQHRFDIGTRLDAALQRMELIKGGLPPSSKEFVDEDSITSRVERSLAELDVLYHSTNASLSSADPTPEAVEQAKALEVSSLELYMEAKRQLQNEQHLLLIPCLVLHLDACDLVLREDTRQTTLNNTQRSKLLGRTVATALRLVELQVEYFGKDHYDVARTNLDLSQSIQELLAKFPDQMSKVETHRVDLNNFRAWSSLEYKCQKEYERIKELYPRDASNYLAT
jgi:SET domain